MLFLLCNRCVTDKKNKMNDEILLQFIEQRCSEEEARKVLQWIEANEGNRKHFNQLQAVWASVEIDFVAQHGKANPEEVRKIMKRIRGKRRQRMAFYISAAAAVAAVVLLMLYFPFTKEITYDYEKALAGVADRKEITLTVEANREIELTDSSAVIAYNRKGNILINDTLEVEKEEKAVLNTIHVPYGKRSVILLEDGTRIHLNSGSSLAYPATFASDKREVYLEGEAYFEVTKEEKRGFVVQTAYRAVEVLGTQFNVWVDKSETLFETVLVTGKIGLESNEGKIELAPNQFYGYSAATDKEEVKTVDVKDYISWIEGRLRFKREPLSRVLGKLEKAYNIKITLLDPTYLNYQITGSLDLKSTPEETLDVVMKILIPNYDTRKQKLYQIKNK